MSIKIQLADGSFYNPNKQEAMTMKPNEPKPAEALEYREEVINGEVGISFYDKPARTALQIATELDEATKYLATSRAAVVDAEAAVKRITLELRNFGRKPRAPKGTP